MANRFLTNFPNPIKSILCFGLLSIAFFGQSQQHLPLSEPNPGEFKNVQSILIAEDSLSSSFLIWVKQGVAEHYHAYHTENVIVLEGTATMTLNERSFTIRPGDHIFIPAGTRHSVTVEGPEVLKVISIQSPRFDGTDRIGTKSGTY